ncbi:MAG: TRAP transporter small permease subunit [Rhodobacteraceae bacterium]|nr:TRAP transporter small permease subunit [Paracoccaceae bacterium]
MLDGIVWLFSHLGMGFVDLFYALTHPASWLNWGDKQAMMKFIYYGASTEFLFVVIDIFLVLLVVGVIWRNVMWRVVRIIEGFSNAVGRFFAWAGLIMVLQQIMIIFLQRIFRVSEISIGPFGMVMSKDISWYAEELKLFNAFVVTLACAYTFVQGGHVRVDLFYSKMKFRTKRVFDMFGSIVLIMPTMMLIWMFGWFFMWRHLVTPKVAAANSFDALMRKAQLLKWNVETIGFSPNGFNGYFIFKILIVSFAGMMILQGAAFFFRSLLECIEGPESEGKYLDKDKLNDELAETVAAIH